MQSGIVECSIVQQKTSLDWVFFLFWWGSFPFHNWPRPFTLLEDPFPRVLEADKCIFNGISFSVEQDNSCVNNFSLLLWVIVVKVFLILVKHQLSEGTRTSYCGKDLGKCQSSKIIRIMENLLHIAFICMEKLITLLDYRLRKLYYGWGLFYR